MSDTAAQPKRSGGKLSLLLMLSPAILLPLAPATFALALVFMLPTIIIGSTRLLRVPGALATMFGMNLSGALPGLVAHWKRSGSFDDAFRMMLDPEFVLVNLAASGIGLVLLFAAPFIARAWVDIASARLRSRAISQRKRLLDEWGDEVRGDHPPPSL
ncbi:MAG: hypothetical protein P1U65_01785 [Minwuia sp.]|nr:hypothetical protein [Minwuia sp.]